MSLDVYLTMPGAKNHPSDSRIFIREDGQNKEISRGEWDARFPGREPLTVETSEDNDEVYSANITHNLNRMASEAGIYAALWRPDEIDITKAGQLIEPLKAGLDRLVLDPDKFKEFNPSNGWGDYEGLVTFVRRYLMACEKYPDADVYASR